MDGTGLELPAGAGKDALSFNHAPAGVRAETEAFASEFSDLGVYVRDCLVHIKDTDESALKKLRKAPARHWPEEWVTSFSDVYDLYYKWAKYVKLHEPDILSKNAFSRQLKGIGYETTLCSRDGHLGRYYLGVKMVPPNALGWDAGTIDFTE